jgi:DNA-directed RNA polymerase subunit M/transcription elongation factor TFIIS
MKAACANCNYDEAVIFLAEQTAKSKYLSLVYICCNCGHKWISEPKKDDEGKDSENKDD